MYSLRDRRGAGSGGAVRHFPATTPSCPATGPFVATVISPRVVSVKGRVRGPGSAEFFRMDFHASNVNVRQAADWIVDALNARWNTEKSIATLRDGFKGVAP